MTTERTEAGYLIRQHDNGAVERILQTPPPPAPPLLSLSGLPPTARVGEQITVTAEVRTEGGDLVPVSGAYYVPVVRRADGWQAKFLAIEFTDGQARVEFSIPDPGTYILRLDEVEPRPQSRLADNPKLIVTGA